MEKYVDTSEYMGVLEELTRQGKTVSVPVSGGSMLPFLAGGRDKVYFAAPNTELRRGDMVFYRRPDGKYVFHRVVRCRDGAYDMAGDAQTAVERAVPRDAVFARAVSVERKGVPLEEDSFLWRFFAGFWLAALPLRRVLLGLYGLLGN